MADTGAKVLSPKKQAQKDARTKLKQEQQQKEK